MKLQLHIFCFVLFYNKRFLMFIIFLFSVFFFLIPIPGECSFKSHETLSLVLNMHGNHRINTYNRKLVFSVIDIYILNWNKIKLNTLHCIFLHWTYYQDFSSDMVDIKETNFMTYIFSLSCFLLDKLFMKLYVISYQNELLILSFECQKMAIRCFKCIPSRSLKHI